MTIFSAAVLFPDERTVYRRKVILTICLVLAVGGSIGAVVWRWTNGVDTQNHAVRVMFSVMDEYVKTNQGAWPKNWDDLESMPSTGHWYDPIDFPLIRQEVLIDFDADLQELAGQSPGDFQAIRAKNPVFDFARDPRLVGLLSTIREFHPPSE